LAATNRAPAVAGKNTKTAVDASRNCGAVSSQPVIPIEVGESLIVLK
jgi:hypothetical protein